METNLVFAPTRQKPSAASFLWQMLRNPLDALTELAREQGDIAHVKIGKRDLFLLNHPEFIEQALVKQGHNFIKGPALQRARVLLGEACSPARARRISPSAAPSSPPSTPSA